MMSWLAGLAGLTAVATMLAWLIAMMLRRR